MCEPLDRYVIRTRNLKDWNLTRYRCANRSYVIGTFVPGEPGSTMGLARSGKFFLDVADLAVLTLDAPQKDIIFGANARELRMVIITLGATPGVEIKEVDAKT